MICILSIAQVNQFINDALLIRGFWETGYLGKKLINKIHEIYVGWPASENIVIYQYNVSFASSKPFSSC